MFIRYFRGFLVSGFFGWCVIRHQDLQGARVRVELGGGCGDIQD